MGRTCCMHGGSDNKKTWRYHLGRIILKQILKRWVWRHGMDSSSSREGHMLGVLWIWYSHFSFHKSCSFLPAEQLFTCQEGPCLMESECSSLLMNLNYSTVPYDCHIHNSVFYYSVGLFSKTFTFHFLIHDYILFVIFCPPVTLKYSICPCL